VMPMALAYASYLMCENRQDGDSCGKCANCLRIKKLVHPDMHFIFPKVSASDSGKYDKVLADALPKFRNFVAAKPFGDLEEWALTYGNENKNLLISREDSRHILKNVSMRSVEGGYKILIIWYPELMNPSSANAILKILEEPPEKTIYLLVTYNYDLLLSTITSRSQLVVVPPNSTEEITEYLKETGVTPESAAQVAEQSEGKIGMALNKATEEASFEYKVFQKWMLECWNKDLTSLIKRSEEFSKSGKTMQRSDLGFSSQMIRNAVIKAGGSQPFFQNEEEATFISKYAQRLGMGRLEKIYMLLNTAMMNLDRNSNPRITHLNLSLDIIHTLNS